MRFRHASVSFPALSIINAGKGIQVARLLIADNDADAIKQISAALTADGHQIAVAHSMEEAMIGLRASHSDMLLLGADDQSPKQCSTIRTDPMLGNIPIICMVASNALEARLDCFRQGADDCVGKPFEPAELVARVNAVLHRTLRTNDPRQTRFTAMSGRLAVDPFTHTAQADEHLIQLTPTEFQLIFALVCSAGKACSSDQLLETVWGHLPGTGDPALLRTQIKNLRRKLAAIDDSAEWVLTIPNSGYLVPA